MGFSSLDPTWQRRLLILLGVGALLMIVYIAKLSAFSAVDLWSNVPVLDATTAEHAAALQSIPLFLHFHKAGGSFACRLAAKSFPLTAEQQAGGCALLGDGPESLAQGHAGWANSDWTCGERLDYLMNHGVRVMFVEKPLVQASDWCPGMFRYITIIRDPIARIESSARAHGHSGSTVVGWLSSTVHPSDPNALLFEGTGAVDNHYIRVLLGRRGLDIPAGGVTADHLDQAKEKLARFGIVMTLETIDRDLEQLWVLAGWQRPGPGEVDVKASSSSSSPSSSPSSSSRGGGAKAAVLDSAQRAAVERANALDLQLYEFARERAGMLTAKARALEERARQRKKGQKQSQKAGALR